MESFGEGPCPHPRWEGHWMQTPPALCGRKTQLHLQQICLLLTLFATYFNKLFMDSCRKESYEPSRLPLLYLYLIKPVFSILEVLLFHSFASSRHPGLSCSVEADDLTRRGRWGAAWAGLLFHAGRFEGAGEERKQCNKIGHITFPCSGCAVICTSTLHVLWQHGEFRWVP